MSISIAPYPTNSDKISASFLQDSESDNHEEIESSKSSKNTNTFMAAVPSTPQHVGREITPIETVEDSVHTFYKSPSPTTK
jgi:hypothetical protein